MKTEQKKEGIYYCKQCKKAIGLSLYGLMRHPLKKLIETEDGKICVECEAKK